MKIFKKGNILVLIIFMACAGHIALAGEKGPKTGDFVMLGSHHYKPRKQAVSQKQKDKTTVLNAAKALEGSKPGLAKELRNLASRL